MNGQEEMKNKVYKVVLTGGPCGGKTTGQARLCTFFEHMGWRVFRVPEAASVLLSSGIKFGDLTVDQSCIFQENLLKTMMQIENTVFALARTLSAKCLVICDRGVMDASAFIPEEQWEGILKRNDWNEEELRDNRYDQIIHMVSAANGAESFYSTENNVYRSEKMSVAKVLDGRIARAWIGHPSYDVIDNSTDFEDKMRRMMAAVCQKLGLDVADMLQRNSKKYKFLVQGPLPDVALFHEYKDFQVVNTYLHSKPLDHIVLTKRGARRYFSHTYSVKRTLKNGHVVEIKSQTSKRDYINFLFQKDNEHCTVRKKRRCFLDNNQYFQLDVYKEPRKGLLILETYSALDKAALMQRLPSFLIIARDITDDPDYSMFNLSLRRNAEPDVGRTN